MVLWSPINTLTRTQTKIRFTVVIWQFIKRIYPGETIFNIWSSFPPAILEKKTSVQHCTSLIKPQSNWIVYWNLTKRTSTMERRILKSCFSHNRWLLNSFDPTMNNAGWWCIVGIEMIFYLETNRDGCSALVSNGNRISKVIWSGFGFWLFTFL